MQRIECPNCYSTVILMKDGSCPACNKMPDASTSDWTRTKIKVWPGERFPSLCFGCGDVTDSMKVVSMATSSTFGHYFRMIMSVLLMPLRLLVFGLLGLLRDDSSNVPPFQRIRVKIPVCLRCRNSGFPRLDWTDFESGAMSFIVPRAVASGIKELRLTEKIGVQNLP